MHPSSHYLTLTNSPYVCQLPIEIFLTAKLPLGSHFTAVYSRVVDTYLLVDREAETSIKYFALQLFTVPSVASHIVRYHDLVMCLLDIIINFFTN